MDSCVGFCYSHKFEWGGVDQPSCVVEPMSDGEGLQFLQPSFMDCTPLEFLQPSHLDDAEVSPLHSGSFPSGITE